MIVSVANQSQGPVTPVLIHRAVLGSVERIMALLIEHYHSRWPFWLNPRQVIILTVNDDRQIVEFARHAARVISGYDTQYTPEDFSGKEVKASHFHGASISVDVDGSPRPLGKKLSEAKRKRYSVVAVVGRDNFNSKKLTVDISGIPDNGKSVCRDEILRFEVAQEKLKRDGEVDRQGAAVGSQFHKSPLPPALQPGQLKKITISPLQLREVLTGLERAFV